MTDDSNRVYWFTPAGLIRGKISNGTIVTEEEWSGSVTKITTADGKELKVVDQTIPGLETPTIETIQGADGFAKTVARFDLPATRRIPITEEMLRAQRESFARSGMSAGTGWTKEQIEARLKELDEQISQLKVPNGAARNAMEEEKRELERNLARFQ